MFIVSCLYNKKRTDIINLLIRTIHCDISKQAIVEDTVIHKVFNSIFLSVLFKLNAWECVDVFALKIKLNTWCYFPPSVFWFRDIVWLPKRVYQHLKVFKYATDKCYYQNASCHEEAVSQKSVKTTLSKVAQKQCHH